MGTKKVILVITWLITGIFIMLMTECKKPATPKAVVTVYDTAGNIVEGAKVILKPTDVPDLHYSKIKKEGYTNEVGQVSFEHEDESIINASAAKYFVSYDTIQVIDYIDSETGDPVWVDKIVPIDTYPRYGLGVVKFVYDEIYEEKIILNLSSSRFRQLCPDCDTLQ